MSKMNRRKRWRKTAEEKLRVRDELKSEEVTLKLTLLTAILRYN